MKFENLLFVRRSLIFTHSVKKQRFSELMLLRQAGSADLLILFVFIQKIITCINYINF